MAYRYRTLFLARYSTDCIYVRNSFERVLLQRRKLLSQWFLAVKVQSSSRQVFGRNTKLLNLYGISMSHMTTDLSNYIINITH